MYPYTRSGSVFSTGLALFHRESSRHSIPQTRAREREATPSPPFPPLSLFPDVVRVQTRKSGKIAIDPRKRSCPVMPSPWYVHPFEAHERGATLDLRFYSRNLGDAARAELYCDVLWKLYGEVSMASRPHAHTIYTFTRTTIPSLRARPKRLLSSLSRGFAKEKEMKKKRS